MALPPLTEVGELPLGVHPAHLSEVLDRFGVGSAQRRAVALRLARIYQVAVASGHLARFVVFGSFVTAKREPADVDVFLLMEDAFDAYRRGANPFRSSRCSGFVWRERFLVTPSGDLGGRGRDDRAVASEARW